MRSKKALAVSVLFTLFAALAGGLWFLWNDVSKEPHPTALYVEEELYIPPTTEIQLHDGRLVQDGKYETPINLERGTVVSRTAVFTVKEAYNVAISSALQWSQDAELISIRTLGAFTSEGKSGGWQLMFGSLEHGEGFEIVLHGSEIVSKKEVPATQSGFTLPVQWYDSPEALASLRSQPTFADATVSSLNFFYNEDGKRWGYALSASVGVVSMPVK